jgi:hypothetical protein
LIRGFSALAVVAFAGAAVQAAPMIDGSLSASPSGVITAGVNTSGLLSGAFTYDFFTPTTAGGSYITVPVGQFSGSLTTTTNAIGSTSDFDFGTVSFVNAANNAIHYDFQNGYFMGGLGEMSSVWTSMNNPTGVLAGQYFLRITGLARGDGSFGGQVTFNPLRAPAVPEMATWAMMVAGFGMMGMAMRRTRRVNITFA